MKKIVLVLMALTTLASAKLECKNITYTPRTFDKSCYNDVSKSMYFRDVTGDWHKYHNVPKTRFTALFLARNPNRYFLDNIRGKFYVSRTSP